MERSEGGDYEAGGEAAARTRPKTPTERSVSVLCEEKVKRINDSCVDVPPELTHAPEKKWPESIVTSALSWSVFSIALKNVLAVSFRQL